MRYLFTILLLAHGLIHLMGFVKAFKFAEIAQLTQTISRIAGVFWLIAALLFVIAAILFFLKQESWWLLAALALIVSQCLIVASWQDVKFGTLANVIIGIGVVLAFGSWNYYQSYQKEVQKGLDQTASRPVELLTEADLTPLPAPVARYLRYSGAVGKPRVHSFRIDFSGQIRKNEQSPWMPFVSEQYNFMEPATRLFFMHATMKNLPIAGFHSFQDGTAFMDIRLLSLFKVQYETGPEMGISETVTFFNDMCCMAPATLIDPRIQWLEVTGNKVKASFTNHGITISAWLFFDEQGALVNFVSDDRYAAGDHHSMQKLPWSTPLKDYRELDGHRLVGNAETIYTYPEGDLCYGTFKLVGIAYNCKAFKRN